MVHYTTFIMTETPLKALLILVAYLTTLAQYEKVAATGLQHDDLRRTPRPRTYQVGDAIDLKVNSIKSFHTQIPKSYYALPFCQPDGGPELMDYGFGDRITGNQIQQSSPYYIEMLKDTYCAKLCQRTLTSSDANVLKYHIANGYENNWFVDSLPSAYRLASADYYTDTYSGRFPIGFIDFSYKRNVYIYNHVNIILEYNQREDQGYRVVRFVVQLFSINHSFSGEYDWDGKVEEGWNKTLATCNDHNGTRHVQWDTTRQTTKSQIVEAGEKVIFTYDVIWRKSVDWHDDWSNRWEIYMTYDDVPAMVHWLSVSNSLIVIMFLSALITSNLIVNLKKDKNHSDTSHKGDGDEKTGDASMEKNEEGVRANDIDTSKLKIIHADIFLPPTKPLMFCVIIGSGSQLTLTSFLTIAFGAIGYINPFQRGSFMNVFLISFVVCGIAAGYVSSRYYKAFHGKREHLCTSCTAILFPGLCFATFSLLNWMASTRAGAVSVPISDIINLAVMWCFISIPAVFIGAHVGQKMEPIEFPSTSTDIVGTITRPNHSPCAKYSIIAICIMGIAGPIGVLIVVICAIIISLRKQIPRLEHDSTSWANKFSFLKYPKLSVVLAGIFPFGVIFLELFFIMSNVWMAQHHCAFGFILLAFLMLLITCAEETTLLVYYSLFKEGDNNEIKRWWWFALLSSGSVGGYIFLYSFSWFQSLAADQNDEFWFVAILYFGYMSLVSIAAFLVTGYVGSIACLYFLRKIICPLSTSNGEMANSNENVLV